MYSGPRLLAVNERLTYVKFYVHHFDVPLFFAFDIINIPRRILLYASTLETLLVNKQQ